ncbi:MAG: hypothetical protein ACXWYR_08685 [Solirubrobacterales bacterium]
MRGNPKVLVVLFGETRATELTAESFRANVLEALGADLALCVRAPEEPDAFHDSAEHLLLVDEPEDTSELYDVEAAPGWRALLGIRHGFLGGIEGGGAEEVGRVAPLYYYRWRLWRWLSDEGVAARYDWIVLSRADFIWPAPHPHVRYLSDRHVHILDGEEYGGICDRHIVVPRRHYQRVLGDLVEPIFTEPESLKREVERVRDQQGWSVVNSERLLALRLRALGLWPHLRRIPYVPYTVRPPGGRTAWSVGTFDEERGYYVKYPTERIRSELALRHIGDQDSWRVYLAPLRGALRRIRLRRAYRRHGLYERAFTRRAALARALRKAGARLDAAEGRLGRGLRRLPGAPALLDARMRRVEARAARRRLPQSGGRERALRHREHL